MTSTRRERQRQAKRKYNVTAKAAATRRAWYARFDHDPVQKAAFEAHCRDVVRRSKARTRAREKQQAVNAYGGCCFCCGESDLRFLTIDHPDGNGARHRREIGGGRAFTGTEFYVWLRKQGYPSDYRVLCFNCNCGRQVNGGICPHEEVRRAFIR